MDPLTPQQQRAFDALRMVERLTKRAPTRAELGSILGISPSWAHRLVKMLQVKGYVTVSRKMRGITIRED